MGEGDVVLAVQVGGAQRTASKAVQGSFPGAVHICVPSYRPTDALGCALAQLCAIQLGPYNNDQQQQLHCNALASSAGALPSRPVPRRAGGCTAGHAVVRRRHVRGQRVGRELVGPGVAAGAVCGPGARGVPGGAVHAHAREQEGEGQGRVWGVGVRDAQAEGRGTCLARGLASLMWR